MTLARFEHGRVVEYTSEQRGLPAARHWRHFQEADGAFAYRIVIEYSPGRGGVACSTGRSSGTRSRTARAKPYATSKADSASNANRQTAPPALPAQSDRADRR